MASLRFSVLALLCVVGCGDDPSGAGPDAGVTGDGEAPDAELCMPACGTEPNADVECTAFATCESTCSTGFSRCGDTCVTESAMQCGAGCNVCPDPANGSGGR